MPGILLGILKVIGIILAVIICLVIILLLLVLFVPIRYNVEGAYNEKKYLVAKVTWLLSVFGVYITFDGNLNIRIRILFFYINNKKKNKKSSAHVEKKHKQKHADVNVESEPLPEIISDDFYDEPVNEQSVTIKQIETESNKKVSLAEKIKGIVSSVKNTVVKIKDKTISLKNVSKEKYDKFNGIVNNPQYRELLDFMIVQVKILLKKILPKKYKINLLYGFDDPSITGKLLGYYYSFYGFTGFQINVTPDFDNAVFQTDGFVKGNIRIISLVIIGLRVYTNKLVRKYILKKNKNK